MVVDNHEAVGGVAGLSLQFTNNTLSPSDFSVAIDRTVVSGNSGSLAGGISYFAGGSGPVFDQQSSLTISNSTISNNTNTVFQNTTGPFAAGGGGLSAVVADGQFLMENTTVSGNTAPEAPGGGIFIHSRFPTTPDDFRPDIVNSTISSNTAGRVGGGIHLDGGVVLLSNSTLFGNSAAISGNTIHNDGALGVKNSIIAASGGACSGSGPVSSRGHNIATDGTCSLTAAGDLPSTDPLLAPLQDQGGATQVHPLLPDSPAINAISVVDCTAFALNPLPIETDQLGQPRPEQLASNCDIGSFEEHALSFIDPDGDGIPADVDNCELPNPDQKDIDRDGIGDPCDPVVNVGIGFTPLEAAVEVFSSGAEVDIVADQLPAGTEEVQIALKHEEGVGIFEYGCLGPFAGDPSSQPVPIPAESGGPGNLLTCQASTPTQESFTGTIAQFLADGQEVGAHEVSFIEESTISLFDGSQERPFTDFGQSFHLTVEPQNQPPTPDPGGPYSVDEGSSVVLDGTGSSDPDGTIAGYLWDLDRDERFGETGQSAALGDEIGPMPSFDAAGIDGPRTVCVELLVIDDDGDDDSDSTCIKVLNVPPEVLAAGSSVDLGEAATVSISFTDPAPEDTHFASIDWGDGSSPDSLGTVPSPLARDHLYATAGTCAITVTVTDDDGGAGTASATIEVVGPENGPPVAGDDTYGVNEDTVLDETGPGILSNDSDPDGDSLSTALVSGTSHGDLSLNADGSFTYTPAANFHGVDSFKYLANDGTFESNEATVVITVNPVNDPPAVDAGADQTALEGASITLSATGSDVDGDLLCFSWSQLEGPAVDLIDPNTSQVTFTAPQVETDTVLEFQVSVSDGEESATDRVLVAVTNAIDGWMTGGGSVFASDGERVTHGFTLQCDTGQRPNNLQLTWGKGNKFHLEDLTSAVCIDDQGIEPNPPPAGFDTYQGSGTGRFNGESGFVIEWTFTDAGEPGTADTAQIEIRDQSRAVALIASGSLEKGDHQAHSK